MGISRPSWLYCPRVAVLELSRISIGGSIPRNVARLLGAKQDSGHWLVSSRLLLQPVSGPAGNWSQGLAGFLRCLYLESIGFSNTFKEGSSRQLPRTSHSTEHHGDLLPNMQKHILVGPSFRNRRRNTAPCIIFSFKDFSPDVQSLFTVGQSS